MRTASGSRENSDEIERDIARTRADMDETVSEIQRRLRPERLRREAKHAVRDTFRDTAQGARNHMFDTIKENPVPSVLAGLSIGWLIAKGSSSSSQDRYEGDRYVRTYPRGGRYYEREDYGREPYYAGRRGGAYREERYYDESDDYRYADYDESGARHEDNDEGRSASERAGDAASGAQQTAKRYGHQAQRQARRAASRSEEMMEDNPLAVGAATLALGAFAGLLLPSTRKEDELMGETRDRVVHQAQSAAQETAERAQHVAEKTAEDAKETAKEEAKKEKEKSDRTS